MKILFMAPFGIRPKGTVLARMLPLAVELQSLGDEVTIVAPPYTNPEDSGKTECVRGVKLVNVTLPPGGKALGAPALALRMYRATLAEKPELVHLFKPKGYGGLAAMLHLVLRHPEPLFVDTDDWEGKGGMNELHRYSPPERWLFDLQERWLPPRAAGVTVASRALQEQMEGRGVPQARLLYLPNCVEDTPLGDGAKARERMGIDPRAPVVLLYTRFFEFSQERLHRVFAEIFARVPTVRFLVVGKGRHGEEALLLRAAADMKFTEALMVAGWAEPAEIPDLLAAADVALYPLDDTLVNRAKCPAKLAEIIRMGVPVVADRVGQATEYVEPGISGVLTNPDSPAEMAEEAVALLRDPERRLKLGSQGRQHILGAFTCHDMALKLREFYRRTITR